MSTDDMEIKTGLKHLNELDNVVLRSENVGNDTLGK